MMKLNYISEDNLFFLKENSELIYKEVLCGNKKIDDYIKIEESSIDIEPFELIYSDVEDISQCDAENVQRIYGRLNMLTLSQAADERIWTAYTLGYCINYMKRRWKTEPDGKWKPRYLFGNSQQRSLYRNGMARLWWIGHAAYDKKREDPYELVKMICSQQYLVDSVIEPNFASNPTLRKAILNAIFDAQKEGLKIDREGVIRPLSKYVNIQSSTYILDMLSYDELYLKFRKCIDNLGSAKT